MYAMTTRAVGVTFEALKHVKVDMLSDYDRRALDCWIAEHVEGHTVKHLIVDIRGEGVFFSDIAWSLWKQVYPCGMHCYNVPAYSFSPSKALQVWQTNPGLTVGWTLIHNDGYWFASNLGLEVGPCKSMALTMMLALKQEYQFRVQYSQPSIPIAYSTGPSGGAGADVFENNNKETNKETNNEMGL